MGETNSTTLAYLSSCSVRPSFTAPWWRVQLRALEVVRISEGRFGGPLVLLPRVRVVVNICFKPKESTGTGTCTRVGTVLLLMLLQLVMLWLLVRVEIG